MRILITNDDGIDAAGLRVLTEWARKLGDVTVVAPKFEQSAKSQSILLRTPFEVRPSEIFKKYGIDAYLVDSTPADCVRFAVDKFGKFDVVFSGINRGLNMGYDVSYSGTCAAIFEANYARIPAVAFSTTPEGFSHTENVLDGIWEYFEKNGLLSKCDLYNVNIPKDPHGYILTAQGGAYFRDSFEPCGNDMFITRTIVVAKKGDCDDLHIDTEAVFNGLVSITPMTVSHTRLDLLKEMIK